MLNIIVAPKEYNAKAEKNTKKVVKLLKVENVEYSVHFSRTFDELKENVKQLLSFGETEFVIVGDDVVINTIISCIKDLNKVKFGIIPTSKHDDFASYLGISSNPVQAMKDILTKNLETVDLLLVNDMLALNSVIIGASVEIYNAYEQYKIKNFISEKFATLKHGNNFSGVELALEHKNTKTQKPKKEIVFELVVANGGNCKGKPVSPLCNMQDGLFNLIYTNVAHKSGKRKYIKKQNGGKHIYDDDTKQSWLTNLKITNPDKKIKALVDGKIQNFEEVNISILENALKIFKKN